MNKVGERRKNGKRKKLIYQRKSYYQSTKPGENNVRYLDFYFVISKF